MTLLITAPIFALIAVGYVSVRTELISQAMMPGLGRFVLYIAVPALIFRALTATPIGEVFQPSFIAAYAGGSVTTFVLALLVFRALLKKSLTECGLGAFGSSFSNVIFIGYPIFLQLHKSIAGTAFTMALLVDNFVNLPLALIVMKAGAGGRGANLWQTVRGIAERVFKNPLMVSIVVGIGFSLLDWELPAVARRIIHLLADASPGAELFYIGGVLVGAKLGGRWLSMGLVTGLKLTVQPAVVGLLLTVLPPIQPELRLAAIVFATSPMLAIYPVIASKYGMEQEAATTLLIATAVSFATISTWLAVLT